MPQWVYWPEWFGRALFDQILERFIYVRKNPLVAVATWVAVLGTIAERKWEKRHWLPAKSKRLIDLTHLLEIIAVFGGAMMYISVKVIQEVVERHSEQDESDEGHE
jgi:hypothetical protein